MVKCINTKPGQQVVIIYYTVQLNIKKVNVLLIGVTNILSVELVARIFHC
jgi:hypothetical protein